MKATIAGAFLFEAEEPELRRAIESANSDGPCVEYVGFVGGDSKQQLLEESDCMCFPTYYSAEGQPVSLLEAMAFDLQIVTTRWRAIPEMLDYDRTGFCTPRDANSVASALLEVAAKGAEHCCLLSFFDSLGNGCQAQHMSQIDQSSHDCFGGVRLVHRLHEGSVDFDRVNRKLAQIAQ